MEDELTGFPELVVTDNELVEIDLHHTLPVKSNSVVVANDAGSMDVNNLAMDITLYWPPDE